MKPTDEEIEEMRAYVLSLGPSNPNQFSLGFSHGIHQLQQWHDKQIPKLDRAYPLILECLPLIHEFSMTGGHDASTRRQFSDLERRLKDYLEKTE